MQDGLAQILFYLFFTQSWSPLFPSHPNQGWGICFGDRDSEGVAEQHTLRNAVHGVVVLARALDLSTVHYTIIYYLVYISISRDFSTIFGFLEGFWFKKCLMNSRGFGCVFV